MIRDHGHHGALLGEGAVDLHLLGEQQCGLGETCAWLALVLKHNVIGGDKAQY